MHWRDAQTTMLHTLVAIPRLGLVTDMDGTISPIVPDPDAAQVTPRSRALLKALQPCLALVAVVSGRAADDVRARVATPGVLCVGNHGLEVWSDGEVKLTPEAAPYRPAIEAAIRDVQGRIAVPGMLLEDKGPTVSIHYRQVDDPEAVARTFRPVVAEIADRHGLTFFEGRMIFELRPPVAINKGTAFRQLVHNHRLEAAVFLGDDITDVDALRMARRLREQGACYALGLGVESAGTPSEVSEAADLVAEGVSGVEAFLAWLLDARKASSNCA